MLTGFRDGDTVTTDHNQFIRGEHSYQANYRRCLRILRLTDPAHGQMIKLAFLDTVPEGDSTGFIGAWST